MLFTRFVQRPAVLLHSLATALLITATPPSAAKAATPARSVPTIESKTARPNASATAPKPPVEKAEERTREGTELVNQLGYFLLTGDRVAFFTSDSKRQFVGLENLTLERVARVVADNPERLQWVVSGTVTEYRGAGYVLVRRAILKGRAPSTASTTLSSTRGGDTPLGSTKGGR